MSDESTGVGSGMSHDPRPTLGERWKHVFGIHSWRPPSGADSPFMRCPGCGQRRSVTGYTPPPPVVEVPDPVETSEAEATPTDEPDARLEPDPPPKPEASGSPSRDGAPTYPRTRRKEDRDLLQRIVDSPWWVKMWIAIVVFQVVGIIASRFAG